MTGMIDMSNFYTCIVIEVEPFESRIVDEQHFRTLEDAQAFQKSIPAGMVAVIATL